MARGGLPLNPYRRSRRPNTGTVPGQPPGGGIGTAPGQPPVGGGGGTSPSQPPGGSGGGTAPGQPPGGRIITRPTGPTYPDKRTAPPPQPPRRAASMLTRPGIPGPIDIGGADGGSMPVPPPGAGGGSMPSSPPGAGGGQPPSPFNVITRPTGPTIPDMRTGPWPQPPRVGTAPPQPPPGPLDGTVSVTPTSPTPSVPPVGAGITPSLRGDRAPMGFGDIAVAPPPTSPTPSVPPVGAGITPSLRGDRAPMGFGGSPVAPITTPGAGGGSMPSSPPGAGGGQPPSPFNVITRPTGPTIPDMRTGPWPNPRETGGGVVSTTPGTVTGAPPVGGMPVPADRSDRAPMGFGTGFEPPRPASPMGWPVPDERRERGAPVPPPAPAPPAAPPPELPPEAPPVEVEAPDYTKLGQFADMLGSYDPAKVHTSNSPRYRLLRLQSHFDPREGVTPEFIAALNATMGDLGTFERVSGDKIRILNADPEWKTEFSDLIRDFGPGGANKWHHSPYGDLADQNRLIDEGGRAPMGLLASALSAGSGGWADDPGVQELLKANPGWTVEDAVGWGQKYYGWGTEPGTKGTPQPTPAETGPPKDGEGKSMEDLYREKIIELLNTKQTVDPQELMRSPESAAFRLAQQREQERGLATMAETAAYGGAENVEGRRRQFRQAGAESTANFVGTLALRKMEQNREDLQRGIQFAMQDGQFDKAQALQLKLAELDAAIRREQIASQEHIAMGDQELRRMLGLRGMDDEMERFWHSLGFDYTQLQGQMNRDALLALLTGGR